MNDDNKAEDKAPIPAVSVNFMLTEDFNVADAQAAMIQVAKAMNQMAAKLILAEKLSAGSPATQQLMQSAATAEGFIVVVEQMKAQQRQQAGILTPQMRVGPVRMN